MTASLSEEVLRLLLEAKGAPVSGEAAARRLNVTRAAVWKAIENLRGEGYPIESLPSRGYLLASGSGGLRKAEIEARLTTRRMGRPIKVFDRIDSTNREAARLAAEGAFEGAVVVAKVQSAGRGRLGRSWHGDPEGSLMFSIVLRPQVELSRVSQITHVAALSLARALTRWLPEEALEIKWPNDVLARGRKVAGILLESRIEGGLADYVIAGIGINVQGSRESLPEPIRETAAVLGEEADHKPSRAELLCEFLERFEEDYEEFVRGGFSLVKPSFDRFFRMTGKYVKVSRPGGAAEGEVAGMTEDGALRVTANGRETLIHAGDIEYATTKD